MGIFCVNINTLGNDESEALQLSRSVKPWRLKMNISADELNELIPSSDSATVLHRMAKLDRLPKYKKNSFSMGDDCSDELKDLIRKVGMPSDA